MQERISNIKDRSDTEGRRDLRIKRNKRTLQEVSYSIRKCNRRIIGIPEEEGEGKGEPIQTNS